MLKTQADILKENPVLEMSRKSDPSPLAQDIINIPQMEFSFKKKIRNHC
jgi:hypothetical protein